MSVIRLSHGDFADLSSQILTIGPYLKFQAYGTSMRPFIQNEDILLVTSIFKQVDRFDVLLFYDSHNGLKAHRVIAVGKLPKSSTIYLMQGDALSWNDGWIDHRQVIGKVSAIERNGEHVPITWFHRCLASLWHLFVKPSVAFLRRIIESLNS